MNPGELRHRITFQKMSVEKDVYGAPINIWTDVVTVWASINPVVGREYFASETVQNEISHKIKLRHISILAPDMRGVFGGRYFYIKSIINYQERGTELQLMCKEQL